MLNGTFLTILILIRSSLHVLTHPIAAGAGKQELHAIPTFGLA